MISKNAGKFETTNLGMTGKGRGGKWAEDIGYTEATIWLLLERALGTPCHVGLPVWLHWFLKEREDEDRQCVFKLTCGKYAMP